MPIVIARWLLRRAIIFAIGRIAAPFVDPYKKDLHRAILGVALIFAGGIAGIACGLALTPLMAIAGIVVLLAGLFLCGSAMVSTFRHARTTYRQSVALGRRTWPRLRALRPGKHRQ